MRQPRDIDRPVTDETYVELVRSVFMTRTPTTIMGILFIVVAGMATRSTPDRLLLILAIAGSILALLRVAVLAGCARRVADPQLTAHEARLPERVFGIVYLAFAAVLGLFAARAFQVGSFDVQMVVAPLIVGYAAGVAAGLSLRPWICVPAVLMAVVPMIAASLQKGHPANLVLAFVLAALLAGGIGSMVTRYRSEIEKIGLRQVFATMARKDHLTGLTNRLSLAEAFAHEVEVHGVGAIAVHCLDLDRFKQVNDDHGHPVGDLLLQHAAARLNSVTRRSDVAARLGGDEFVVLQSGVAGTEQAEMMARRIVRALSEPYLIEGKRLNVGVSVGYALAERGDEDLSQLLEAADRALYEVKRCGGGTAGQAGVTPGGLRLVAG